MAPKSEYEVGRLCIQLEGNVIQLSVCLCYGCGPSLELKVKLHTHSLTTTIKMFRILNHLRLSDWRQLTIVIDISQRANLTWFHFSHHRQDAHSASQLPFSGFPSHPTCKRCLQVAFPQSKPALSVLLSPRMRSCSLNP